jgi:hypothetical protein
MPGVFFRPELEIAVYHGLAGLIPYPLYFIRSRPTVFVILAGQKCIRPRSWRHFHVLTILKTSK